MQTPEELKTRTGEEAFNPDGLVQRSIRLLKDKYPDLEVSFSPELPCMDPSLQIDQGMGVTCKFLLTTRGPNETA